MLPISEIFYSWQGEGCHMGKAAFFIRLYGCPVQCPWCDSAETWRPELRPKHIRKMSVKELVTQALKHKPEIVVITGGEPAIYNLLPLTDALHAAKIPCHLETSGGYTIRGDFDWITLSPKRLKMPLAENLSKAHELKLIIETENDIAWWVEQCGQSNTVHQTIWLHPEWSKSKNKDVLNSITQWIKAHGAPFRAGWQLHKCYDADTLHTATYPPFPCPSENEN